MDEYLYPLQTCDENDVDRTENEQNHGCVF